MEINRDSYLDQLIERKHNGLVKVITGLRRVGKSFLLFNLFKRHLIESGVKPSHIVEIALDQERFESLQNPILLAAYIREHVKGRGRFYVLIDEIQLSLKVRKPGVKASDVAPEDRKNLYITFYDVLNEFLAVSNVDLYVTGSNSRMLSKDVATNFRDRGTELRMFPLSFAEYYAMSGLEKADAWADYVIWGGMPLAVLEKDEAERARYLSGLFEKVYVADVAERYGVEDGYLESLIDVVASAVGSLTNPSKLANTLNSVNHAGTTDKTVKKYLDALEDAFIFEKARRYDVKGKAYLDSPVKYYATDVGLRNARLGFRQIEETHLMENILYNDLIRRGYAVDVGTVRYAETRDGKKTEKQHEIDFVVNLGIKKVYIQSAFRIDDEEKRRQEILPLLKSGDFFKKIVVTSGSTRLHMDDSGIQYVGIIPFLLDENSIEW